jgi:hypothetical protein
LPLTIAAIVVGILFGFKGVKTNFPSSTPLTARHVGGNLGRFVMNLFPFFAVLLLTLFFKVHLAYSLAIAVGGTILYHRLSYPLIWRLAKISFSWEIVFLIWGIMIFKEILMVSGAMNSVAKEFIQLGLPPLFLILTLPAILGLITGYSNAYVGLSFPILLPLFQASAPNYSYVMMAYCSGFCAVLLSPMHACLVMTREYFKADMGKVYRLLILPVGIVFVTGLIFLGLSFWVG